jgi:hypothetical protein
MLNHADICAKDVSKSVQHVHRFSEWQFHILTTVVSLGGCNIHLIQQANVAKVGAW